MNRVMKGYRYIFMVAVFMVLFNGCAGDSTAVVPDTPAVLKAGTVWDLNGEWDGRIEFYGIASELGSFVQSIKIVQKGQSFVATTTNDSRFYSKDKLWMKGEIDSDGNIKAIKYSFADTHPTWGHIADNGNKIMLNNRNTAKGVFVRKD